MQILAAFIATEADTRAALCEDSFASSANSRQKDGSCGARRNTRHALAFVVTPAIANVVTPGTLLSGSPMYLPATA